MGDGTADDLKGRTKEAAGDLTGDDGLKREGKVDRATRTERQGRRRERQAQGRREQEVHVRLRFEERGTARLCFPTRARRESPPQAVTQAGARAAGEWT